MLNLTNVLFIALGVLASSGAVAAQKPHPESRAINKEQFDMQAAAIRTQMQAGGAWAFVDARQHAAIEWRLDEISRLLEGNESADTLSPDGKAKLLVAQEEINAILTRDDGRRITCDKSPPVGSHLLQLQCQTSQRRDRDYRETYKYRFDRLSHNNN